MGEPCGSPRDRLFAAGGEGRRVPSGRGGEKEGGAEDPFSLLASAHVCAALWAAGQAAEGERLLRAGLGGLEREFPNGHFDLTSARFLLGETLAKSGRDAEARPLLQQALERRQTHLGSADPRTAAVRRALDS